MVHCWWCRWWRARADEVGRGQVPRLGSPSPRLPSPSLTTTLASAPPQSAHSHDAPPPTHPAPRTPLARPLDLDLPLVPPLVLLDRRPHHLVHQPSHRPAPPGHRLLPRHLGCRLHPRRAHRQRLAGRPPVDLAPAHLLGPLHLLAPRHGPGLPPRRPRPAHAPRLCPPVRLVGPPHVPVGPPRLPHPQPLGRGGLPLARRPQAPPNVGLLAPRPRLHRPHPEPPPPRRRTPPVPPPHPRPRRVVPPLATRAPQAKPLGRPLGPAQPRRRPPRRPLRRHARARDARRQRAAGVPDPQEGRARQAEEGRQAEREGAEGGRAGLCRRGPVGLVEAPELCVRAGDLVPPLRLHRPPFPPRRPVLHLAPALDPSAPRPVLVDLVRQGPVGPRDPRQPRLDRFRRPPPATRHPRHGPRGAPPPVHDPARPRARPARAPQPRRPLARRRPGQTRRARRARRGARRRGHVLELCGRGTAHHERAVLLEHDADRGDLGGQVPPLRHLPPPRRKVLGPAHPAQGPLPRPHRRAPRTRRPPHLGRPQGRESGQDAQDAVRERGAEESRGAGRARKRRSEEGRCKF